MSDHRCQSCGIVLSGVYGSNRNGSPNTDYCPNCFKKGAFTQPSLNIQGMIQKLSENISAQLRIPEGRARIPASAIIPLLKRWKQPQIAK
ncbi:zinc ribbon domain-containing protein, partial [Candidatus Pacearchaeota archaeon]|nr:zinc ribbon domain-containing protein [Candidatus Pacearchaeota archaeon]